MHDQSPHQKEKLTAPRERLMDLLHRIFHWNYRRDRGDSDGFRLPVAYLLASSVVVNLLSLMLTIMMLHTYDRIIPNKSYETMMVLAVVVCIALIFESILKLVRSYLLGWAGAVYEHQTYVQAIRHLLASKQDHVDKNSAGNYIQGLSAISKLREFYSGQALVVLIDLPFILIYLFLIAYFGKLLVLAPLLLIVVFVYMIWRESQHTLKRAMDRENASTRRISFIMEILRGIHTVKSLGAEKFFLRRGDRLQENLTRLNYLLSEASGKTLNIVLMMSQMMTVVVVLLGSILVVKGMLSMGGLAACILLAGRIMQPIQRSITFIHKMHDFEVAHQKLNSIFDLPVESSFEKAREIEAVINVKSLAYDIEGLGKNILKDINFETKGPKTIAILGPQDSGKTTLYNLLAGRLSPKKGSVAIDGVDPRKIPDTLYPQIFAYITVKGAIFTGTIHENLNFFGAIENDVAVSVAQELGIESATSYLPLGYETLLNDNGSDPISPSTKQRIAIARSLALKPKIIILDHADSALDMDAIKYLRDYLLKIKDHCLIFITSNNHKLLEICDETYTLVDGMLIKGEQK